MISRRTLVPLLAGGVASLRRLRAETSVCDGTAYDYQNLESTLLNSSKHYKFAKVPCLERPLWSKLAPDRQKTLANQIQIGYLRLIQRSIRKPRDLGGLIGQAWIHHRACSIDNIHRTSAFLPWHRAFLYFHERWLQQELRDPTFRLPVWDWENKPAVPPIFDDWLKIPKYDGSPLGCNYLGANVVDPIDSATLKAWLLSHCFIDFTGGSRGSSLSVPNAYRGVHSNVHTALGGLMKDTKSSALHPVFYMHHANVDRYWFAWWQDYMNYDGFAPEWVKGPMLFADPHHGIVKVWPEQVAELTDLGYKYCGPTETFFQYTNICAVAVGNKVSLNPNAFLPPLRTLLRLLAVSQADDPATTTSLSAPFPVDPQAALSALLSRILTQLADFALPVRMNLRIPGLQPGLCYPLFLDSLRIGNVSFFGPKEHLHDVLGVGHLKLADLSSILPRMLHPGLTVTLGPASNGEGAGLTPKILAFEILHPDLDDTDQNLKRFFGI